MFCNLYFDGNFKVIAELKQIRGDNMEPDEGAEDISKLLEEANMPIDEFLAKVKVSELYYSLYQ